MWIGGFKCTALNTLTTIIRELCIFHLAPFFAPTIYLIRSQIQVAYPTSVNELGFLITNLIAQTKQSAIKVYNLFTSGIQEA